MITLSSIDLSLSLHAPLQYHERKHNDMTCLDLSFDKNLLTTRTGAESIGTYFGVPIAKMHHFVKMYYFTICNESFVKKM